MSDWSTCRRCLSVLLFEHLQCFQIQITWNCFVWFSSSPPRLAVKSLNQGNLCHRKLVTVTKDFFKIFIYSDSATLNKACIRRKCFAHAKRELTCRDCFPPETGKFADKMMVYFLLILSSDSSASDLEHLALSLLLLLPLCFFHLPKSSILIPFWSQIVLLAFFASCIQFLVPLSLHTFHTLFVCFFIFHFFCLLYHVLFAFSLSFSLFLLVPLHHNVLWSSSPLLSLISTVFFCSRMKSLGKALK